MFEVSNLGEFGTDDQSRLKWEPATHMRERDRKWDQGRGYRSCVSAILACTCYTLGSGFGVSLSGRWS